MTTLEEVLRVTREAEAHEPVSAMRGRNGMPVYRYKAVSPDGEVADRRARGGQRGRDRRPPARPGLDPDAGRAGVGAVAAVAARGAAARSRRRRFVPAQVTATS